MSISVSLAPVNTEVSVSSANDISVSLTSPTTTVEVNNQALALPQSLGTGDSPTFSSVTASQALNNSITDTSIDASEFAAFAGTKIIYTGGAGSITLPDAVSGDVGKAWIVVNAGTGAITVKRDTNSQVIKFLNGSAVSSGSANLTLAVGSAVEIICTAVDNYIAFGSGIS